MTSPQKTSVNIVFGAMTFGKAGKEQVRTSDPKECAEILDVFQSHGHNEVDTARFYGQGSSEVMLADIDWKSRGIVMDTKYYPTAGAPMTAEDQPEGGWRHTAEHIRTNVQKSLDALKTDKLDMWYLHGPDRTTPYEETFRTVNELHQKGLFRRVGISNYQ